MPNADVAIFPEELRAYVDHVRRLADDLRAGLERALANGATLAACADQVALDVGRLASPRMLDLAVRILLSQRWHENELRAWHCASLLALPENPDHPALVLTLPAYHLVRRRMAAQSEPATEVPR